MKSYINYSIIISVLMIFIVIIIDITRPKISVLVLSYNRPENLDKSLPILNNYYSIDEIIVSHGSKDHYKEFNYRIKKYKI